MLTLAGLMSQYYVGAKKLYMGSFAKDELVVVSKALSNHIASSSGNFLFKVKNKLKLSLENGSETNFSEDLRELSKAHEWTYSQALALDDSNKNNILEIIKIGTSGETFVNKYKKNTDLDFKYDVSLIESEFLETYPLETDKKLLASLISEDKINKEIGKLSETYYEDRFMRDNKLKISEETLTVLLDENSLNKVKVSPNKHGLEISSDGLKIEDLPTGLRFKVSFPIVNFSKDKKDSYKEIEIISNSQLRLTEKLITQRDKPRVDIPVDITPLVDNPVLNPPYLDPDPRIDDPERVSKFDLMVRSLPTGTHAILVNPDREISEFNPVRIANNTNSAITTIYTDKAGHLNISIGKIKDEDSLIGLTANERKLESNNIAILETFTEKDKLENTNLIKDTTVNNPNLILDVLPRENKRYGTVDEAFKYQGIDIPKGSVVVATKTEINDNRPENKEFSYFKVYDSNGALITKFHTDDLGDKSKVNNVNFTYTERYTEDGDGTAIYQSFSTADLFKGKSSNEAIKAFLNIQADLASTQQLNINQQRKDWHENLYSNFKEEGVNYTGKTLETNDPLKAAEILIAEKSYVSEKAKELDKKQVTAMLELEVARDVVGALKDDLQQAKERGSKVSVLNDIKQEIKEAEKARDQEKKELTQARDKYDDYMANRAKNEPVKVANEPKQTNTANNQPKAAPAPQVVAVSAAPKVSAPSSSGGGGGGKRR